MSVGNMNWRYAVGEVLLIIIGVTVALAGTAWYEDKQKRREEISALQQLRETLAEDVEEIIRYQTQINEFDQDIRKLISHIESSQPYTAELEYYFGSLASWRSATIRTAPFEALKSGGFELISSTVLRSKLVAFYEDAYPSLQSNSDIDRDFVRQKVWAYFFEHFRKPDMETKNWRPVDYERVRIEPQVLNFSKWRIRSLNTFLMRDLEIAIAQIREILHDIEAEIGPPQ